MDFRSDLWSLGVIAFRCLTGRYPFEGEAIGDLLVKICTAPLPKPSSYGDIPTGFDDWFEKAMQREPALRFASAAELADQLARSCGIKGGRAMQPSAPRDLSAPSGSDDVAAVRNAKEVTGVPLSRTLSRSTVNRRNGLALAAIAATVFLLGSVGGIFWLLSRKADPDHVSSPVPSTTPVGAGSTASAMAVPPIGEAAAQPSVASEQKIISAPVTPASSAKQPITPSANRPEPALPRAVVQPHPARNPAAAGNAPRPRPAQNAPADLGY